MTTNDPTTIIYLIFVFLIGIWAPAGIFIYLLDDVKRIQSQRRRWQLISALGCISILCVTLIWTTDNFSFSVIQTPNLWVLSAYFIIVGWSFFFATMGFLFGFLTPKNATTHV
ncbi:MAG: hypothetical protein KGJ89_03000 [Patescibacteria group bacterium]|nr:hypothetical protein [Patescibacteria group bacterium]MDE2015482.1 hypothetical protein [Patescibacteria group bacterium]MDE2226902.1 hypothetical protein [Patescibacteria group bacterium]